MSGTRPSTLVAVLVACLLAGCRTAGDREPVTVVLPPGVVTVDAGQCKLRPPTWDCDPGERCAPTWNAAVSLFRDVCAALKRDSTGEPRDQIGRPLPMGKPELFENCEGLSILRLRGVDYSNSFYYDAAGRLVGLYATSAIEGPGCAGRAPPISSLKGVSCAVRNCESSP
jgi:hypothetical protein